MYERLLREWSDLTREKRGLPLRAGRRSRNPASSPEECELMNKAFSKLISGFTIVKERGLRNNENRITAACQQGGAVKKSKYFHEAGFPCYNCAYQCRISNAELPSFFSPSSAFPLDSAPIPLTVVETAFFYRLSKAPGLYAGSALKSTFHCTPQRRAAKRRSRWFFSIVL